MGEAGIFTEEDRVELIEGEIFEKSPIGSRHASCVKRLNTLLVLRTAQIAVISVQDPIEMNDYSEPQPDLALLKWRAVFYASEHPKHNDALHAIEVSDTTLAYDREYKIPLYARAKIPQAVIVNLPAMLLRSIPGQSKANIHKFIYSSAGRLFQFKNWQMLP